ncbi:MULTISPECIES: hypothetical protein [Actinoplanes]|uniref:hypothetical protein n=1 Tax=Actinoplanes TaxID=1865 RepID=UPI0005F28FD9|nr:MULTISPECIES: hypothetical protein [Actinoplanes]GLY07953.1 hypothetical protein Acsp01_83320 [Actinoplanes sp. NBRC 101535]
MTIEDAEELLSRPFPRELPDVGDWLEGAAQSGANAHFVPLAVFASLHDTPADYDDTAWPQHVEAFRRFEQQRQEIVVALTARWGPPRQYSFRTAFERVVAGDDSVSSLEFDLAMFAGDQPVPAWPHGDRVVALLLGQMDKEFPIVLTVAAISADVSGLAAV